MTRRGRIHSSHANDIGIRDVDATKRCEGPPVAVSLAISPVARVPARYVSLLSFFVFLFCFFTGSTPSTPGYTTKPSERRVGRRDLLRYRLAARGHRRRLPPRRDGRRRRRRNYRGKSVVETCRASAIVPLCARVILTERAVAPERRTSCSRTSPPT